MKKTMKTAVMVGPGSIELGERDVPSIRPDQVLVKVEYAGICGSDIHIFQEDWGKRVTKPFVLGHECAGTVVETGSAVTGLKLGDRVALEPGWVCGKCSHCRSGRYNLCRNAAWLGAPLTPPVDGVFLEYVAHGADMCFKLPSAVSLLEGALIEPLAVGFHAARIAGAGPGRTAMVIGAGCIGLMAVNALRTFGVSRICIVDVLANRLERALSAGATYAINSGDQDATQAVLDLTEGHGCDIVVDTSGNSAALTQAVDYLDKGGTLVLVGYSPSGTMTLPSKVAINKEIAFKTVFRYCGVFPLAIEAVASGDLELKEMVTGVYPLERIQEAFETSINDKATTVKTVIKIAADAP